MASCLPKTVYQSWQILANINQKAGNNKKKRWRDVEQEKKGQGKEKSRKTGQPLITSGRDNKNPQGKKQEKNKQRYQIQKDPNWRNQQTEVAKTKSNIKDLQAGDVIEVHWNLTDKIYKDHWFEAEIKEQGKKGVTIVYAFDNSMDTLEEKDKWRFKKGKQTSMGKKRDREGNNKEQKKQLNQDKTRKE